MPFRPQQQQIASLNRSVQCQAKIFQLNIMTIQILSLANVIIRCAPRLENSSFVYLPRFISISRRRNTYLLADSRGFFASEKTGLSTLHRGPGGWLDRMANMLASGLEGVGPSGPESYY